MTLFLRVFELFVSEFVLNRMEYFFQLLRVFRFKLFWSVYNLYLLFEMYNPETTLRYPCCDPMDTGFCSVSWRIW